LHLVGILFPHEFFTSALDADEWSLPSSDPFTAPTLKTSQTVQLSRRLGESQRLRALCDQEKHLRSCLKLKF